MEWELPDDEVAARFLNSTTAEQSGRRRGPYLAMLLGQFLAATHAKGGLQSVPLVDDADGRRSFGRVVDAVVIGRPDWQQGNTWSLTRAARRAAEVAAREVDSRKATAAYIRKIVDDAPPLTDEQIARLRALIGPPSVETYRGEEAKEADRLKRLARRVRCGDFRTVGGAGPVRLWWDGNAEYGWELSEQDLVDRFVSSQFGDRNRWPQPVEQVLAAFVSADEDDEGLQSDWLTDLSTTDADIHRRIVDMLSSAQRQPARPVAKKANPPIMAAKQRARRVRG